MIDREITNINKTKVYFKDQSRRIICFCGKEFKVSILPHLRKEHPDVWKEWQSKFLEFRNEGLNYRQIMYHFLSGNDQPLFSWSIIERETNELLNKDPSKLIIPEKGSINKWEPVDFKLERTTVWDFHKRGNWAVHDSKYRGNWPPQIPRNLILKYTTKDDIVVDPFVGGGTTLIESWLLGRRSIGIDINPIAIRISKGKVQQMYKHNSTSLVDDDLQKKPMVIKGDSRKLETILQQNGIEKGAIGLFCVHPPYMDSLKYSNRDGDLSLYSNETDFLIHLEEIAAQIIRLLKNGGICAVLIGDVRKHGKFIPLGVDTLKLFQKSGLDLLDVIIKIQRHDFSTEFYLNNKQISYALAHEYLLIFKKGFNIKHF
ncbi:MAG: hypothetical protein JRN10_01065 [Nitrososphaerota archaeon]|jgi:DNA modification methylase|nr:hypothetical protein [Nitrososphaerota archaeon]MDG7036797.1 hypothetical protein [Nitrososphaerota archaeon]MDG7039136.1 hypothetical protein [Nitrososphaerota archaeon]